MIRNKNYQNKIKVKIDDQRSFIKDWLISKKELKKRKLGSVVSIDTYLVMFIKRKLSEITLVLIQEKG